MIDGAPPLRECDRRNICASAITNAVAELRHAAHFCPEGTADTTAREQISKALTEAELALTALAVAAGDETPNERRRARDRDGAPSPHGGTHADPNEA